MEYTYTTPYITVARSRPLRLRWLARWLADSLVPVSLRVGSHSHTDGSYSPPPRLSSCLLHPSPAIFLSYTRRREGALPACAYV